MSGSLVLASLSLPAMLGAGLSASPHCAVMCGVLHARYGAGAAVARHLGRLGAYTLIGAVAGGAGQWLLRAAAWLSVGEGVRIVLLLGALLVLLLKAGRGKGRACCAPIRAPAPGASLRTSIGGFATVLAPCAPLYAAAAYAALSASAASGALLLLAFGVGTVPAVQAGAWTWSRMRRGSGNVAALGRMPLVLGLLLAAMVLIAGIVWAQSTPWCVT